MSGNKEIHHHFSRVAPKYLSVRTTDTEPVLFIKEKIRHMKEILAADIGCGCGRYDIKLLEHLRNILQLFCIDASHDMLRQLKSHLGRHKIGNFHAQRAIDSMLPLKDSSMDCIFTFNAIHHFDLHKFLDEVRRILKDGGYLFIYSRLRTQNRRNIWGRHFPHFARKEVRLYYLKDFKKVINSIKGLEIETIKYFKYLRILSLKNLLERARSHHYSTFYLYSAEEFEEALKKFRDNILKNFEDPDRVSWHDENILLVVRKETSAL